MNFLRYFWLRMKARYTCIYCRGSRGLRVVENGIYGGCDHHERRKELGVEGGIFNSKEVNGG